MSSFKILLVDDSHEQLNQMSLWLEKLNYEVLLADNSRDAIEITRFSKPDLIIIDVNLAHEDGIKLCKDLRIEKLINRPYIFLISSLSKDEDTRISGLQAGADDYIHRPIPKREFLAKIDAGLRVVEENKKLISDLQTQANLWDIIEKSHVIVFVWKNSDRMPVEFVSENISQFGYSQNDFLSGSIHYDDIIFKDDLQKVIYNFDEKLKSGATEFREIYRVNTKSGEIRWVEDCTQIYKKNDDEITHFQGIIIDITDIRSAQESQRESDIRYHNLLETINDGFLQTDKDDRVIFANRKFLELGGYSLKDITNKIASEIFVFPEERDFMSAKISERMKGESDTYQTRLRRKDGTAVWISVSSASVRNQQGKVIGSTSIISDITQKKLIEDRLHFHSTILHNVHDSIIGFDLSGKINYWNIGAENFYGLNFSEVQNKSIIDLWNDEVYQNLNSILSDAEFELIRKRNDGRIVITNSKFTHLNDQSGKIIGYLEVSKDISNEVAVRNEKYLLQELIGDVTSSVNIDAAFKVVVEKVCQFANWSIGEVWVPNEEKTGFSLAASYASHNRFEPVIENVKSRTLKMNRGLVGKVWNSGKPLCINDMNSQSVFSHSSILHDAAIGCALGIPITYEKMPVAVLEFFCEGKKIFNENLISIVSSIASQLGSALRKKEAEEEHKQAVEKFKKIFDNSPQGIFQFDTNCDMIIFNPAFHKILGYSTPLDFIESFNGKISEIFSNLEDFEELINRTNENNFITDFECELKKKDKSSFWASLNLARITSTKKKKNFYEGMISDITTPKLAKIELQRAKDKAEELGRLREGLLANMSHELRTPMISILGYAELLREGENDEGRIAMFDSILAGSNRLLETLGLILEISRLQANREEINFREVDIVRIIKSCYESHKKLAKEKNIKFICSSEYEHFITETDERLFLTVLNNLVNNALKFTNKGEVKIEIKSTSQSSDWYSINVIDSGIGIKQEDFIMIFDEFRQASEGLSRNFEGTGLGLSISKKIVNLLDGNISLQSKIDEGSIFTISFPIKKF